MVVPEIGEDAPDARRDEHVSLSSTSVREASARRSNDADGVSSPIEVPNTVVKPLYAESTCLETGWEDR